MSLQKVCCPLCDTDQTSLFHQDKKRPYLRCHQCALVFIAPPFLPTRSTEIAEYKLHQNNVDDAGYLRFLSRLVDSLTPHVSDHSSVLDYGSGPCPALATLLVKAGYDVDCYDPIFGPHMIKKRHYDVITATEVIEHFHYPKLEWLRWMSLLRDHGWLGIMTKRVIDAERFANWHYKNDPTHVCFFSEETFNWLGTKYGLKVIFSQQDVVLMQKQ